MANDGREPSRLRSPITTTGLAIALGLTVGVGWNHTHPAVAPPRFCTAEGYIRPDGTMLMRDNARRCAWVDPQGNLVTPPTR